MLDCRPNDLSAWDRAAVLQGVQHPGQQTDSDLRRCQADLQVGRGRVAQHWNRERAATGREVHTTAAGRRWRLLDCAPPKPTALQGRGHNARLPLTVLLAGWKQGQVQVCVSYLCCDCISENHLKEKGIKKKEMSMENPCFQLGFRRDNWV